MTFHEKIVRLTADRNKAKVSKEAGQPKTFVSDCIAKRTFPSAKATLALSVVLGVDLVWLLDDQQGWPAVSRVALPPTAVSPLSAEKGTDLRREIKAAADIVRDGRLTCLHRYAQLLVSDQLQENRATEPPSTTD